MTNKQLSEKIDELMGRLPQPEVEANITPEVKAYIINSKIDSFIIWAKPCLTIIACSLVLMVLPMFLSIDGCKQNPNPPVTKEILIDTKAEYEIVMDALDFVANEWALSRYDSVAEAKQGLSSLLGGSTGGVKSRPLILAEFKDDCDFLAVVEDVKKKSV